MSVMLVDDAALAAGSLVVRFDKCCTAARRRTCQISPAIKDVSEDKVWRSMEEKEGE